MEYNKRNIVKNLIWKFSEKIGIQLVNIIIQIVLTRILLPEDYASVAIIMVFVLLANLIVQSGFGSALVQKENVDSKDYSSVFYLCILVSIILYGVLYVTSPYIADFYDLSILSKVLRVQAVILFPCAINTVQVAFLSRNMEFAKNFAASIIACVLSGIGGIVFAVTGFGIWAIVATNVLNQVFLTVALWFLVKWRPTLEFSFTRVKSLFVFGWKLLCSSILGMFYGNLQTLIIGKVFTPTTLGYYNRGELMGTTIMSSINNAISAVMLPVLSRHQNDMDTFKQIYRRTLALDCFFSFPVMFGLASVSQPLIAILFTEKWLPAVPFMIMICISRAFDPIHTTNLEAILAVGKSGTTLKLEIIKKTLGVLLMVITYRFGIYVFVASNILLALISTVINAFPNKKNFGYSVKQQVQDIFPYLLLSLIMFAATFAVTYMSINYFAMIILQISMGVGIYVTGCYLFKLEAFVYVCHQIKEKKAKK